MKRKFFTNYSRPHGRFNPCQQICKADQPDCEAPGLKCAENYGYMRSNKTKYGAKTKPESN